MSICLSTFFEFLPFFCPVPGKSSSGFLFFVFVFYYILLLHQFLFSSLAYFSLCCSYAVSFAPGTLIPGTGYVCSSFVAFLCSIGIDFGLI